MKTITTTIKVIITTKIGKPTNNFAAYSYCLLIIANQCDWYVTQFD